MRSIADMGTAPYWAACETARGSVRSERSTVSRSVSRYVTDTLCRNLDDAVAALETMPDDRRRASALGLRRIAFGLGIMEPAIRSCVTLMQYSLRWLYSAAFDRRDVLLRERRFQDAGFACVLLLLERNGELTHREVRAWFDRLEWRRVANTRFYGLLCRMEAAELVTGRYVSGADGRDRAFTLPPKPSSGGTVL